MYHRYIQCLSDQHIIIEHVPSDFNISRDTVPANRAVIEVLNTMPHPVPYILDFTGICEGCGGKENVLAEVTRGAAPAYSHRNIQVLCVVAGKSTVNVGALALAQAEYHGIAARVFETIDAAMQYARSLAGEGASRTLVPHAAPL